MADLAELLARVKAATGPDRELDALVWASTLPSDGIGLDGYGLPDGSHFEHEADEDGSVSQYVILDGKSHKRARRSAPDFTASIDAALALVERMLPGTCWLMAKGRTRPDEPLYGIQLIQEGADDAIADEAEHECVELAILAALLTALIHQAEHATETKEIAR